MAKPETPAHRLTPKQAQFVQEYTVDLNGAQAAIRAGFSARTARQAATRMLSKVHIQEAIAAVRQKTAAKLEITRERLLAEYARIAFLDTRKFYRPDGSLKPIPELDDDTAAAIVGFEVTAEFIGDPEDDGAAGRVLTSKVKWSDKKAALDSIARVMGWNQDKMKLAGDEENPISLLLRQVEGTRLMPNG